MVEGNKDWNAALDTVKNLVKPTTPVVIVSGFDFREPLHAPRVDLALAAVGIWDERTIR
jgi:hypothetical protein